jgi:ATP-dependent NAD(P)H-hydrate dehydratase
MHSLVIGPGLGRDPAIMASVKALIAEARKMSKSMVIDADGLHLVTLDPSIVEGYRDVILTPNEAEFQRLYTKVVSLCTLIL